MAARSFTLADELEASPIGMEIGSAHKYAMNTLLDFKPAESPVRPEGEAEMKRRAAERQVTNVCHGEYGWPVAGLLTEPFKIVQTPKLTLILYEIDSCRIAGCGRLTVGLAKAAAEL